MAGQSVGRRCHYRTCGAMVSLFRMIKYRKSDLALYVSVKARMPHIHAASMFPNEKRKSDLYDYFLSHWDFTCSQDDYEADLELMRVEERAGMPNCRWFRDVDGRLVVADLELRDQASRVIVTRDGFAVALKEDSRRLVFISYAREDAPAAERIADAVGCTGLRAWLDTRHLRGGSRWKLEISSIIRKADLFIAVLSSRSVGKRGFVQREIREALEVALSVPEPRVFIVPVRLDHCEPAHSALQELQRIDLFPDWSAGIHRLIQSLHADIAEQ